MYIIFLTYARPMEEVEALSEPHIDWVNRYFTAGPLSTLDAKINAPVA